MSSEREFTREMAIELYDQIKGKYSLMSDYRAPVAEAIQVAHRLGAESASGIRQYRETMADGFRDVCAEIKRGNPQSFDGSIDAVSCAVREIQRVYAELKSLTECLKQAQAAAIHQTKRADAAEREVRRLEDSIAKCGGLHPQQWRDELRELVEEKLKKAEEALPKPAPELKLTDPTKPVMTRAGYPAQYVGEIERSHDNQRQLVFYVKPPGCSSRFVIRTEKGFGLLPISSEDESHPEHIVNVPEEPLRMKVEVRLYREPDGTIVGEAMAEGELDIDGDPCEWRESEMPFSATIIEMEIPADA